MWLLCCCATATRRNCPSALSRPRPRLAPFPLARQGLCCPKITAPSSMDTRPAVLLSWWPSGALRVVLGNSRFVLVLDGRGRGLLPRSPVDAGRRICTVATQLPNRGLWLARTALQKLRHLRIRLTHEQDPNCLLSLLSHSCCEVWTASTSQSIEKQRKTEQLCNLCRVVHALARRVRVVLRWK